MKQTITLAIALMLALISAQAQYTLTLNDVDIDETDGTIYNFTNTTEKNITFPESLTVNGREVKVTGIGSYAFNGKNLTSVTIPDWITRIGEYAFKNNQLTSVTILGATNIGKHAFSGNSYLSYISIPSHKDGYVINWKNQWGDKVGVIRDFYIAYYAKATTTTRIFRIFYSLDGGTAINPTSYTVESADISLSDASKTGYTFAGWYDNFQFAGEAITEIATGSTGEINLWAKYSAINYTISYNLDGGTAGNPTVYTIESAITLSEATKEGYDFTGWYTNAEFTGEAITEIATGTTGDIALWAKFDRATTIKTAKDNSVKIYPNPVTEGYFVVESKSGNGNVTVYALNGNVVLSQIITQTTQTIEIPELPNGIYLVKIKTENGVTTKRLVVK